MAKNDEAAKREMKAARGAWDALVARDKQTGNREVTPAYLKAYRRVIEAEENVSWWRR